MVTDAVGKSVSPVGVKTLTSAVPVKGSTTTLRRPVSTGGPAARRSSTVCASVGTATSLARGTSPSSRMKYKSTNSTAGDSVGSAVAVAVGDDPGPVVDVGDGLGLGG